MGMSGSQGADLSPAISETGDGAIVAVWVVPGASRTEIVGMHGEALRIRVAAPADQPPLMRMHGAWLTTAIAEYFRDRGHNVLLLMDSATRFAMAMREVGLAIGEPPTTKGYTPSVFATLPKAWRNSYGEDADYHPGQNELQASYQVKVIGRSV